MEYIDPQKARQERERLERERQAKIQAEKDRKARLKAEEERRAKAERDRKARLKAEEERKAKLEAEQKDPDKKADPKPKTKQSKDKKPDDKIETITPSKTGQTNPIYGSSSLTYSYSSPTYEQGSVPIATGSTPETKPKVPLNRSPRTWSGETEEEPEPIPNLEHKPYQPRDFSRFKQEIAEGKALKEQKKQEQQAAISESLNPQPTQDPPSFLTGSFSLSTALTNPFIGASLLSGAQALGQHETSQRPEPMQIARGQGAKPQTPEQKLQHKFQTNVASKAQGLLKANKDRLDNEQKAYAQDNNPKSNRWSHLWQVAAQRREFQAQHANLKQQLELTTQEMNDLSAQADMTGLMSTPQERQNSAKHKKLLALSEQKQRLKERIEVAKQMQVSLEYAYPALAAVKNETGANAEDIKRVQGRLPEEFNGIRKDIDRVSGWLTDDPSNAWLFDSVVAAQLRDKSLSPSQRQQMSQKAEKAHPAGGFMLGSVLSGGLFAAALVPALEDIAVPLFWSGVGVGGSVAVAEIPDLMLLDASAQAGRGGVGKLISQSPEQARFNLVMGYANVALAGLDVGAQMGVVQNLKRVMGEVTASGAQVSRQVWGQVMSLSRQGEAGLVKARALLAKAKGMSGAVLDEVMEVLSPMPEIVGVGKLSRQEMRGNTAEPLQTTTAARASGKVKKPKDMTPVERLAYSQDKYGQVKNWDEVEPLIGQTVNQNTQLPAGYRLFQKPGKSKQLFILRESADDGSFVPLMIEGGKIQAGKTRLSRGRKVMEDALKAVGVDTPKGFQLNHLVPDAVAQSDPMMIEMLKRNIYDVDHAGNLLPMPGEVRGSHPDLIGHLGSHGDYNDLVTEELRRRRTILIREHGSLSKVPDSELKEAVKSIEDTMREDIIKRSPDIPTRYDPGTGTRVLSEGTSGPDFVA